MMSRFTKCLSVSAILGLAACGGSGGGGAGASGAAGAASALNYDPVYASAATPTISAALPTTGATGVSVIYDIVNERVVFENVRVRENADGTLSLTINGRTTRLDPQVSLGSRTIYSDGATVFQYGLTETNDIRDIGSSGGTGSNIGLRDGFIGIETPIANLPSGSTTYNGDFSAGMFGTNGSAGVDTVVGNVSLTTDFGTSDLSGELLIGFDQIGTVSGNTQGNGILGTVTLADSFEYSGEIDIIGKTFGANGGTIAGVIGGNDLVEDATGETYLLYGTFDADRM